jgi:tRNA-specific 2-thiouridylase
MSGGVDSSVAALLLIEQGYEVVGVTLKLWDSPEEELACSSADKGCCSLSDIEDARMVALRLGIPHYVLNFKDVFRHDVVDYFAKEYANGRTPNPCIACNKFIKMGGMLDKALAMGFDYIATGHYARIIHNKAIGRYELHRGLSGSKDQSYVLYNFTQKQLEHTLMPLGEMEKTKVREIAAQHGMLTAGKPDSQEICFVPDNDYPSFLERYTNEMSQPGNFMDKAGNVLGTHKGIAHYTIGQRKGLGKAFGKPMFVTDINPATNTVVLGDENEVFGTRLIAGDLNFIAIQGITEPIRAAAKIRYSAREALVTVTPYSDNTVIVDFDEPQRAITPGQSIVFYHGDNVLGGGIIR